MKIYKHHSTQGLLFGIYPNTGLLIGKYPLLFLLILIVKTFLNSGLSFWFTLKYWFIPKVNTGTAYVLKLNEVKKTVCEINITIYQ